MSEMQTISNLLLYSWLSCSYIFVCIVDVVKLYTDWTGWI